MKKISSLLLILFLLSNYSSYSRAGGGGGKKSSSSSHSSHSSSHSSSSHHSSSSYSRSKSSGSLSGKEVLYIFGGIVGFLIVAAVFQRGSKNKSNQQQNNNTSKKPKNNQAVINPEFMSANPGFDKQAFKTKVKTAFLAIQDAWSQQNLSKVRNWISDGIYQRFNMQFVMMKQLDQKNFISNISINQITFIKAYVEGNYSIITVAIDFKMDDKFVSEKMKQLNQTYLGDEATEYWTFVKKSGAVEKDLYNNNSCPNCGNDLNKGGGEISKCPNCGTVTYLGDYDWVLSEITQEDNYIEDAQANDKKDLLKELRTEEEICVQNMEDKASNAFVHYLFAKAWNKSSHFDRFATDDVIQKIKTEKDEPFIYNRVYLNRVTFTNYQLQENKHHLKFDVVYSSQRVQLSNDKVKELDNDVETQNATLTLSREAGNKISKSKLWSHECPNCGAPYTDSTSSKCSYCNEKINTTQFDWVVTDAHTS